MATLVNKHNREVKVIIPNMREFEAFYSDNEGVIGMFFKRDWEKVKQESSWKPSEEQMEALRLSFEDAFDDAGDCNRYRELKSLYEQLKKL